MSIRGVTRVLFAAGALAVATGATAAAGRDDGRIAASDARAAYEVLPLMFEARGGDRVTPDALISHGHAARIAVTRDAVRVGLPGGPRERAGDGLGSSGSASAVTLRFAGASAHARLRGIDARNARIHYLRTSDASRNRVDVPVFGRAAIEELYPGVDAVFYGNRRNLEYDLIVAPGADPNSIAMRVEDASAITLDDAGDAVIATRQGDLLLRQPVAWQNGDQGRVEVDAGFVLRNPREIAFAIGAYDHRRTLVIDPVVDYATYVGGTSLDGGLAIAVDASGSAYIAGYTTSPDFPLRNGFDSSLGRKSDQDAFVAKLAPDGRSLVYATYLGGPTGRDVATTIAVDGAGNAYVAGATTASDFPVTAAAYQKGTTAGGSFVTKLNAAGNALVYSTYVAATLIHSLAIDAAGSAYVAGKATPSFVATAGAFQPTSPVASGATGFVLKLDPAGSRASYATFLGGPGAGTANSIAVDGQGRAYVGGWASGGFPQVLPVESSPGGNRDGYVSVLDASGSRLVSSSLIGGTYDDSVNALALGADGAVYIAGETYSADFPSVSGFQPVKAGYRLVNAMTGSAFVAKLDLPAWRIVWSSFLGGEVCPGFCELLLGDSQYPGDAAYALAVDVDGHAYVGGIARSLTFPLVDSASARGQSNQTSAFVTKVSAAGTTMLFSTFVRTGYSPSNTFVRYPEGSVYGITLDAAGAAYVTSATEMIGDVSVSAGAFQTTDPGFPSAFVVKFSAPSQRLTLESSGIDTDATTPLTMTAVLSGAPVTGSVAFREGTRVLGSAALTANRATYTALLPPGIHALTAQMSTPGGTVDSQPLVQFVDQPLVCSK